MDVILVADATAIAIPAMTDATATIPVILIDFNNIWGYLYDPHFLLYIKLCFILASI